MKDLNGQIVLITGGGSGIGRLMALNFAKEGSRLVLWDLNYESAQSVADEIKQTGGDAWAYACDVSDKDFVYDVADKVKKEVGKVDILVNNAGVVSGKPFLECTDEQVRRTMEVNILAHFWTVKSFLPEMINTNHGHVVTIASAAGWIGVAGLADYNASKFAAIGFDEALRMELRKKGLTGVKTTCICPYYINTGMFEGVKTRFNFLLPILDQYDVSNKIVKAIKNDRSYLKMPPIVYTVPLLRLLPANIFDMIADILGISSTMDEFVGRGEDVQMKKLTQTEAKKLFDPAN